ncbi:hypothetical protein CMI47_17145 [Candidatus Pacearchaeota archaeon]|nr:hypothetical protein [Candidatus Pacearchaeota archaeon]|tara:strand:- start:3175 stop:6690 length:3516 start_codon:yes stop_codon:yes gene_type:complete
MSCWNGTIENLAEALEAYKTSVTSLHDSHKPPEEDESSISDYHWGEKELGIEYPDTGDIWGMDEAESNIQSTVESLEEILELQEDIENTEAAMAAAAEANRIVSSSQKESLEENKVKLEILMGNNVDATGRADQSGVAASIKCPNDIAKLAEEDYNKFKTEVARENDGDAIKGVEIDGKDKAALDAAVAEADAKCTAALTAGTVVTAPSESDAVDIDDVKPGTQIALSDILCQQLAAAHEARNSLTDLEEDIISAATSGGKAGIQFKEQCFLLAHITQLSKFKQIWDEVESSQMKKLPYEEGGGNSSLLVQGDPFAFINKLTQHVGQDDGPTKEAFFDMETYQLSSLQPMIRLFKVISDKDGKESQVEMKFDSFYTSEAHPGATGTYDLEDFFNTKKRRGHGVGIKEFKFSYEADNPFAIKKSIKAKLVLHANTFDELLRDRGGYTYADLALKTGTAIPDPIDAGTPGTRSYGLKGCVAVSRDQTPKSEEVSIENDTKLNFRLKAIVGWARPSTDVLISAGSSLKKAIDDACVSLNLTPTIHEFNIDEQGRVVFTLNYLAYVEDFFDQPMFNIFSDPDTTVAQIERKLKYQKYNKECEPEKVADLRESEKDLMKEETNKSMQSLVRSLMAKDKIKFLDIPLPELVGFQATGPLSSRIDLNKYLNPYGGHAAGGIGWSEGDDTELTNMMSADSETASAARRGVKPTQALSFFYLSDLIDVILEGIEATLIAISGDQSANPDAIESLPSALEEAAEVEGAEITTQQAENERLNYVKYLANFKKFRVVLGPMEVVQVSSPGGTGSGSISTQFVCMGDTPISVKYFIEWLTKKLLKKEEAIYALPKFLNELINEFLRNFLNNDTCFSNAAKQSTRLAQSSLTAYKETVDGPDEITTAMKRQSVWIDVDPDPAAAEPQQRSTMDEFYDDIDQTSSTDPLDWEDEDYPTSAQPWQIVQARRLRIDDPENAYPILSISGQRTNAIANPGFAKEINYLVYFASRTYPVEKMNGAKSEDHSRGIWHYQIGKPRGIVKNINLTKTDSPGLKEVRFEQQGYDGLQQLREVYDAKISTYADVSAFPGNYIYIDPTGFSPSMHSPDAYDLTQLGIGGYHMIIRSEHSFGPGVADTEITAKWVAEIHKEGCTIPKEIDAESDEEKTDYSKCSLPVRATAKEEAAK